MAKKKGWANPPPVSIVSGSESYLRVREVQKAMYAAAATKRRVETMPGSNHDAVDDAVSGAAIFSEPVLLVIREIKDMDPEIVQAHAEDGDNTVAMLLVYEDDIPKKGPAFRVSEAVPKDFRFSFKKPRDYKAPELAAKFVQDQAKAAKLKMPPQLASALVEKVGTDLGVLRWEVLKLQVYLRAIGEGPEVTPTHVMATMVMMGEANIGAVVEAVAVASEKHVLRALEAVKVNSSDDPTLPTVAWLHNRVRTWLHVAALDAQGASEAEGVSRTNLNPYVYSKLTVPIARRWGTSRLVDLAHKLSSVEASVRRGIVDPWARLECLLVTSCRSVKATR